MADARFDPTYGDLKIAQEFIDCLKDATIMGQSDWFSEEYLRRIHEPDVGELIVTPDERLALDLLLANDTEASYEGNAAAIKKRFNVQVSSYHMAKKLLAKLTGIEPIIQDMCIDSCCGFTGPNKDLQECPHCNKLRYDLKNGKKIPRKQFHTLPIAPQFQAMYRNSDSAEKMDYRKNYTAKLSEELQGAAGERQKFTDYFDGSEYIDILNDKTNKSLLPNDIVVFLSIDGAQLYRNKASECWIYVWVIMNLSPQNRYKKKYVLPGGFIPGPKKPKSVESFLFPGLYHLAALQKEGLVIWDARTLETFVAFIFLILLTADGPGAACVSGLTGHRGFLHCRLYCKMQGRLKERTYYPALLKPDHHDPDIEDISPPDVNIRDLVLGHNTAEASARYEQALVKLMHARNEKNYKDLRRETGIVKPSILRGLDSTHTATFPGSMALDVMHLTTLNAPDLMLPLWRGLMACDARDKRSDWSWAVLKGDTWVQHGNEVASMRGRFPGLFGRVPRNPADKISSGYKAWEFLLYFFGIGPYVFYMLLPTIYWTHYCKMVRVVQLMLQEEISLEDVIEAQGLITAYSVEFEELYIQRKASRLHFARPSVHAPNHLPMEVTRIGPGAIYAQWTMERTIGNLGEEIRLHSNPFANLAQRGILRCQVNAIKAMLPDIDLETNGKPKGSIDAGGKYYLLSPVDRSVKEMAMEEWTAVKTYLRKNGVNAENDVRPCIKRIGRMQLPNGDVVRSRYKEHSMTSLRVARNVSVGSI